jgi:hypothetical protein
MFIFLVVKLLTTITATQTFHCKFLGGRKEGKDGKKRMALKI